VIINLKVIQSRWNHIKKFHSSPVREKVSESKDVGKEKVSKSKVKLYECRYCDKNTSKNIKQI
jgi:hypothetical protein